MSELGDSQPETRGGRAASQAATGHGRDESRFQGRAVDYSSWFSLVLIAVCVSVLMCWAWEWERGASFLGISTENPYSLAGLLLFFLVCGKTLCLLTPSIVVAGLFVRFGFLRTANVLVYLSLVLVVAFTVVDSFAVSYYGCHVADILEPILNHLPDIFRFIRDVSWGLVAILVPVVVGLFLLGFAFSRASRMMAGLLNRFGVAGTSGASVAAVIFVIVIIDAIAPLTLFLKNDYLQPRLFLLLPTANFFPQWLIARKLVNVENPEVRRAFAITASRMEDARHPKPVDENAFVTLASPPNILFIMVECLRPSALREGSMPRLEGMARSGLVFENHYSGGNSTGPGLISLLYGRSSVLRDAVRRNRIPPQLCQSLIRSGYSVSFLISDPTLNKMGLSFFLNSQNFDRIVEAKANGFEDADLEVAAQAAEILTKPSVKPQCVFLFLASPSTPHYYPSRLEVFKPAQIPTTFVSWSLKLPLEELRNRYRNSLLWVDELIGNLVDSLGLERTLVVVTSDHGESLGEDGWMWHGGTLSDSQFRVPLLVLGKGVKPARVVEPTVHYDVTPTLLHVLGGSSIQVAGCHGIDVLTGVPADRAIDVMPLHYNGMRTVLVSGPTKRVLFGVSKLRQELFTEPLPIAMVDSTGRIVLDSRQ